MKSSYDSKYELTWSSIKNLSINQGEYKCFFLHFGLIPTDNEKFLWLYYWENLPQRRNDEGFFTPDSGQGHSLASGHYFSVILLHGEIEKVESVCLQIHKCFTFWAQVVFRQMLGECGWQARTSCCSESGISYSLQDMSITHPVEAKCKSFPPKWCRQTS